MGINATAHTHTHTQLGPAPGDPCLHNVRATRIVLLDIRSAQVALHRDVYTDADAMIFRDSMLYLIVPLHFMVQVRRLQI